MHILELVTMQEVRGFFCGFCWFLANTALLLGAETGEGVSVTEFTDKYADITHGGCKSRKGNVFMSSGLSKSAGIYCFRLKCSVNCKRYTRFHNFAKKKYNPFLTNGFLTLSGLAHPK